MNIHPQIKRFNIIPILLIILAFVLGWQIGHRDFKAKWTNNKFDLQVDNRQPPSQVNLDFSLFWDVWSLLSKEYVDKKAIDAQKMYYGAIQGMVAALGDPYTVFLPPAAQKSTKEELGGEFEGVGMQLGYNKDKRLVVIAPLQGTPANKAGIKPGDFIVKIDDKDAGGLSLPEAVNIIRGTKGTKVKIQIYREGDKEPKDLELTRDVIVVKSVELSKKTTTNGKTIAYIKLSRFGEKTFEEWDKAVSDALAMAPQGVIVDVRNNPGGFMEGAVYIGSEFISSGNIVLQENSSGDRQGFPVKRPGKLLNLPLVVLINKGSASASEIVSGAIQDNNRGKLVGDQSFGKGTIQNTQDLPGGTGIHITIAKWLTPNGRWIHTTGLTPDVKVEYGDDETKDMQLEAALAELDK